MNLAKMVEKESLAQGENVEKLAHLVHKALQEKRVKEEIMVNQVLTVYREHQEKEVPQVSVGPRVAMVSLVKRDLLENVDPQAVLDLEEILGTLEEMELPAVQE